jgi:hypothetical protein
MYQVRRKGVSHNRLIALTFVIVVVATVVLSSAPRRPSRGGVAVASTCASSSRQLTDWLEYHRAIGVTRFYIFEEGMGTTAGRWSPDVYVFSRKTADENQKNSPSRFAKWLAPYASGNSTCGANALFVRQTLNLELALLRAKKDGIEWLLHVDVDELVYPAGSSTFDLRDVLARQSPHIDRVVFPNYEAVPERPSYELNEPNTFKSVTLFKRNHLHIDTATYARFAQSARRDNPNFFLAYANGKSACRVSSPGLRPNGAHRFKTKGGGKEVTTSESAILHYPFVSAARARERAHRCDCTDVKECSMLAFDLVLANKVRGEAADFESWFDERVVENNSTRREALLKAGVYARIHAPTLLIGRT